MDYQVKYVSETCVGFNRMRRGRGFIYLDNFGKKIEDPIFLQRFRDLKVPPNWKKVWICSDPHGHIQAVGYDLKGRKQYIYHEEWKKLRNLAKFDKMTEFGGCLPEIRSRALKDTRQSGWPKSKVLGLVVLTLNEVYIRIGNKFYRDENETFGLTTIRRKHLHFEGPRVNFEYKAKSGKYRKVNIENRRLARLIRECSQLPGYEVFRYRENGATIPIDSSDVNAYLRDISGQDFTSKDFRTWGGTVLAIEKLEEAMAIANENHRAKLTSVLVKLVANELGNTLAICREYYIHPAVLKAVELGKFEKLAFENQPTDGLSLSAAEQKVIELISNSAIH